MTLIFDIKIAILIHAYLFIYIFFISECILTKTFQPKLELRIMKIFFCKLKIYFFFYKSKTFFLQIKNIFVNQKTFFHCDFVLNLKCMKTLFLL